MSRESSDQYDENYCLINGFDYDNQAWVIDGKYIDCGHPENIKCNCYGRLNLGERTKLNKEAVQQREKNRFPKCNDCPAYYWDDKDPFFHGCLIRKIKNNCKLPYTIRLISTKLKYWLMRFYSDIKLRGGI